MKSTRTIALDGPSIALAVAIVYASGFVVANVHFARYELVRFELLRGRYLGAGLLFWVLTLAPAVPAFVIGLAARRSESPARERARLAFLTLFAAILVVMLHWLIYRPIIVGRSPFGPLLYSAAFAFAGFVGGVTLRQPEKSEREVIDLKSHELYVLALSFGLSITVFAASAFGRRVFPYVHPAYGGGAVWAGDVVVADTLKLLPRTRELTRGRVLLLDRDADVVNLIGCYKGDQRRTPFAIESSNVVAVHLSGVIALPRSGRDECTAWGATLDSALATEERRSPREF